MTNLLKVLISSLVLLQVIVFVAGALYIDGLTEKQDLKYQTVLARKEELIAEQQKLESTIKELNQTLQFEENRKTQLEIQLSGIQSEPIQNTEQPGIEPMPQPTSTPRPIPALTPTPLPRVTRAS